MSMHSVGFAFVPKQARRRGKLLFCTSFHFTTERLQVRVDVFAEKTDEVSQWTSQSNGGRVQSYS